VGYKAKELIIFIEGIGGRASSIGCRKVVDMVNDNNSYHQGAVRESS
jgi:hypothetical protein